jgi:phage-related protein
MVWQGDSLKTHQGFPDPVKYDFGVELMRVQSGQDPIDWKPMRSVSPGVKDIRVQYRGQYRLLYVASLGDAVYVLNVFIKKTQRTPKSEIDKARARLRDIQQSRRK